MMFLTFLIQLTTLIILNAIVTKLHKKLQKYNLYNKNYPLNNKKNQKPLHKEN